MPTFKSFNLVYEGMCVSVWEGEGVKGGCVRGCVRREGCKGRVWVSVCGEGRM